MFLRTCSYPLFRYRFCSSKEIRVSLTDCSVPWSGQNTLRANISETSLVPLINEQGEEEKGRDEWHFSWCSFLWGFGCRGTERRRAERAAAQWSGSQSGRRLPVDLGSGPDSEVVAKPKRRTFTAEYKQRILMEAETAAALPGGVGA